VLYGPFDNNKGFFKESQRKDISWLSLKKRTFLGLESIFMRLDIYVVSSAKHCLQTCRERDQILSEIKIK
jgi:hypothetical protein